MGQHIRLQAIITLTGIAMTLAFLSFLAFSPPPPPDKISQPGGTYVEGVAGRPQFINPLLADFNPVDKDLTALMFNGLTKADSYGNLEPDLAQEWDVSEDGLSYLFRLRSDVRWHDGQPFTIEDVLFTIGLLQEPDFPGSPHLAMMWQQVTVEQVDETSLRFILPNPVPTFLNFTTIGILPAHHFKKLTTADLLDHPFNLHPIGTGPFKLDRVNTRLVRLSVNPFYNGPPPEIDELHIRFYDTYQETVTAYEQGDILGLAIPPEALPTAQNLDQLNLYNAQLSGYAMIYLNLQDSDTVPFFQEVEIRQALSAALDRQAIIDQALQGQGLPATGPILPWSWAYNHDQPMSGFDLERANNLLTRTGWADETGDGIRERNGQTLDFTLLTNDDPLKIAVAKLIREQWQQVGIEMTIELVGGNLGSRLQEHSYQAALVELSFFGDPDPYPLWHVTQIEDGQNYGGWNNRRASIFLERARTLTDRGQRNDLYFEFQRIFADDMPAIILYHPVFTYGVHNMVQHVQLAPMISPSDRFRNLAEWSFR